MLVSILSGCLNVLCILEGLVSRLKPFARCRIGVERAADFVDHLLMNRSECDVRNNAGLAWRRLPPRAARAHRNRTTTILPKLQKWFLSRSVVSLLPDLRPSIELPPWLVWYPPITLAVRRGRNVLSAIPLASAFNAPQRDLPPQYQRCSQCSVDAQRERFPEARS